MTARAIIGLLWPLITGINDKVSVSRSTEMCFPSIISNNTTTKMNFEKLLG